MTIPISGKNAQILNTCSIPTLSANQPNIAEPIPPNPKAKPKSKPETSPILPGTNSVAYTTIAENADDNTNPTQIATIMVAVRPTCGKSKVNGAAPKMETQIISFLPNRSPKGPL